VTYVTLYKAMPEYSFKQIATVIREAIDPEIEKQFKESNSLYDKFVNRKDLHPWTSDLRSLARMLNGDIVLPHAKIGVSNIVCEICTKAFIQRRDYQKEAARLNHEGILSKENENDGYDNDRSINTRGIRIPFYKDGSK
jgi:hypothetical protein